MYEIITKKRHGCELSDEEIRYFVSEYTSGNIPDYQISALLMAICFRSMNGRETATLTDAIANSGKTLDLSEFGNMTADKHSTGGVGDKTTLIVAPIAASLGCKIAKMSGRGLGHTGGTVDKLESFPGYKTDLDREEFYEQVRRAGIAVVGQSTELAPADKKLYALRDVTATVDSVPLIASSIMGKKLAAGAHTIVLDVKYGSGSFMKSAGDALELAELMVEIGERCGRRVAALITDMNSPLGYAIGNELEVIEAISVLRGGGPSDLREVALSLSSAMAALSLGIDPREARRLAEESLNTGKALKKFKEWIAAEGGDTRYIDDTGLFTPAKFSAELRAARDGYVTEMNSELIGRVAVSLGAGRLTKNDEIDRASGIILNKKCGDKISHGDVLLTVYTNKESSVSAALSDLSSAISIGDAAPSLPPLIYKKVNC